MPNLAQPEPKGAKRNRGIRRSRGKRTPMQAGLPRIPRIPRLGNCTLFGFNFARTKLKAESIKSKAEKLKLATGQIPSPRRAKVSPLHRGGFRYLATASVRELALSFTSVFTGSGPRCRVFATSRRRRLRGPRKGCRGLSRWKGP